MAANPPMPMPIAIPFSSVRRLSWSAGASAGPRPQPRVDAGGYFFFDFLQEGCHRRVAVLGTQLVMGRGGRADLIG